MLHTLKLQKRLSVSKSIIWSSYCGWARKIEKHIYTHKHIFVYEDAFASTYNNNQYSLLLLHCDKLEVMISNTSPAKSFNNLFELFQLNKCWYHHLILTFELLYISKPWTLTFSYLRIYIYTTQSQYYFYMRMHYPPLQIYNSQNCILDVVKLLKM